MIYDILMKQFIHEYCIVYSTKIVSNKCFKKENYIFDPPVIDLSLDFDFFQNSEGTFIEQTFSVHQFKTISIFLFDKLLGLISDSNFTHFSFVFCQYGNFSKIQR